jgi:hypothetical protein
MAAWVMWNNRNNKVWNDNAEPGTCLGIKAKLLWEDWKLAQHQQQDRRQNLQQQHPITRQKPIQGWYKCNVMPLFTNI